MTLDLIDANVLMTDEIAAQLQRLESVTLPETERPIVVKYFTPDAQCTWYILDGENYDGDWCLFGLCDLGMGFPELGSVMLSDLQSVRGKLGLPVERDLHYTGTLADARVEVKR